jgi:hypothetical protein
MGKLFHIHQGKNPQEIEAFLATHKGKIKMSVSLLIAENGSGHVWYSIGEKCDFILALGELELLKQYLINQFYDKG